MIEDSVILRSQGNLVAARTATWGASERDCARIALDRIAAQMRARAFREVRTRFAGCGDALLAEARKRFGVEAARACIGDVPARQRRRDVVVADLGYVFFRANPPYAKLGRVEPKNAPAF